MSPERRFAPRYQLIAEAEVREIDSNTLHKAKTGDLSVGGCFLDMLNPSPKDTVVRVTIFRECGTLTTDGRVAFVLPNLGMGVAFTDIARDQSATLEKWIAELGAGLPGPQFRPGVRL